MYVINTFCFGAKMETFNSAVNLVTRDCWFGSIDLTDAYYSCNFDNYNRRFLRFIWNNNCTVSCMLSTHSALVLLTTKLSSIYDTFA
jgi:hypothetical protein